MVLGIINGWEEGHFQAVRKLGLKAVEFCVNHNYDSAEVLSHAGEIRPLPGFQLPSNFGSSLSDALSRHAHRVAHWPSLARI